MEFKDKIKHYTESSYIQTKFLTLTEQAILKNHIKSIKFTGGYQNPERKRAYLNNEAPEVTCFKIIYNDNFLTLTHQNILGSLMSLNIEYDTIGDIINEESSFFIISDLKDFILNEFKSIGKVSINLQEIDGTNLKRTINHTNETVYVDSLRLDLVISRIANISRTESINLINNDLVKVNHLVTNKNTKILNKNDIISIRKKGRFILLNTVNRSKKGKIVLKYGKFV